MANTIYNVSYGSEDAQGKTHWQLCGVLIVKEKDGKMSLKLNCVPMNCDGWFGIFERDEVKPSAKPAAVINDDFEL